MSRERATARAAGLGLVRRLRAPNRIPFLQVVKTSVAAIAAWLIAGALIPGQLPVFAAIAALLVVQPSVNQSIGKALERSVGVIVGVILATAVYAIFGDVAWAVLLAIVLALVLSWALRLTSGSANQIPISAMLVLTLGTASPNYSIDRIAETMIGAVIALIVNVAIVPPVLVGPVRRDIEALAEEVAASLDRLADALTREVSESELNGLMIEVRLLRPMRDRTAETLGAGVESLALNPRRSKHRDELLRHTETLAILNTVVNRVAGMTRAFRDHYDASLHLEPTVAEIATEAVRAGHDIRLLVGDAERPGASPPPAALTAPLVIVTPDPTHWVLIGSLVEDLRRVHEEVAGE